MTAVAVGYLFHHLAAYTVALQAADARLHLRIAFRVLHLFADFLLAHAQVRCVLAQLAGQVHATEDQEDRGGLPEELHQRTGDQAEAALHALQRQSQEDVQLVARHYPDGPQEYRQQNHGLRQGGQILFGQVLKPRKRVEAGGIRHELLEADAELRGGQPEGDS